MRRTRSRFRDSSSLLVWYRSLPVALCLVALLAALFIQFGPWEIRASQYPLEYQQDIQQACEAYEVNPYWVCAIIKAESNWDPDARSDAGAVGLMQILPSTAEWYAETGTVDSGIYPPGELAQPRVNIEYGVAYFRYLVEHYHQIEPAIAAYNAGVGNVDEWLEGHDDVRDVIEFPETHTYLLNVVRNKQEYEELYPDAFQ